MLPVSDRTMLVLIPKAAVGQVWPLASPYLDKAVKAGSLQRLEEWLGDCIGGGKQLWVVWADEKCHGAGVTSLTETPDGKTCVIDGFAGKEWAASLPVLEEWATAQGCSRVRVYGRIGWMKQLKDYAVTGVILDRKLSHGF
jgi:hypothetical protein